VTTRDNIDDLGYKHEMPHLRIALGRSRPGHDTRYEFQVARVIEHVINFQNNY